MFFRHDVCVAWAHLRLASLELVVHVGIKCVNLSRIRGNELADRLASKADMS